MRRAWRQHRSDLRALFFDRLDDDHLRSLVEIWARLAPTVDGDAGTAGSPRG